MQHKKYLVPFAATMVCCGLWGAQNPAAGDWRADGRVTTELQYDDNPLLLSSGEDGAFGISVSPVLGVAWISPDYQFNARGGFDYDKFSGNGRARGGQDDDLDSFSQHVNLGFNTQDERNRLGLGAGFTNQTTRTSELEDTGIIVTDAYRRTYNGNLSYSWRATIVDNFDISARASDVSFTTDLLTGYYSYGGNVGYRRTVSPLDNVGFSLGFSRTEYDTADQRTSEVSTAKVTWNRKEQDTLDISAAVGGQMLRNETQAPAGGKTEDTEYSPFFELKVTSALTERDVLTVNASSGYEDSAVGNAVVRSRLDLGYARRFTRDVTGELNASVVSTDIQGDGGDRLYYELGPKIGWQFLPDWSLSARYRYRAQQIDPGGRDASSNSIFVALTYRLLPLPIY